MSGFSASWLQSREPVDHAARSEAVLSAVGHFFLNDPWLKITDIGTGTGSTVRAMKPFLPQKLEWHLIDNDEALLMEARKVAHEDQVHLSQSDLSASLDALHARPVMLVTTSAFLDLVSEEWLGRFAASLKDEKLPFYAALTYDGRAECWPPHEADHLVLNAFNQHQKTDKGFGPALGPDAASTAINLFSDLGYQIVEEQSDWQAGSDHSAFQDYLFEGWCSAASEIDQERSEQFREWLDYRKGEISAGNSRVMVGHVDFFAVPG